MLIYDMRVPLLLLIIIALLIVERIRRPFVGPIEYIEPVEYYGVPDVAPRGIQARAMEILQDLARSQGGRRHVVRIVVLTGQSTLHYLDQIVDRFPWTGLWDVRVLLADPESPDIGHLGPGSRDEILASTARLAKMRQRCEAKDRPVTISWRTCAQLPALRGCLIDEDHLFFGYFAWREDDDAWHLHEQNKRFAYARATSSFGTDSIDAFMSWFDFQWTHGHQRATPGEP